MFESGNFKRRKRMRRHSYKPGLYKAWLGESLYRSYPSSLYMPGAHWSSLSGVKTESGGYSQGSSPHSPWPSYTSPLQSSLPHMPSITPSLSSSYHQCGGVVQVGGISQFGDSSTTPYLSGLPSSSAFRLNEPHVTLASDERNYSNYNLY